MTIRRAAPLPECRLCEAPTRRAVWESLGELCSECADSIAATVRMLPIRPAVAPDDRTAFVAGYRPPVPRGQLRLVVDPDAESGGGQ